MGVSGGKVEPGETVHQCIERELAEELGIDVRAGEVLIESAYHYEGGGINHYSFCNKSDLRFPMKTMPYLYYR